MKTVWIPLLAALLAVSSGCAAKKQLSAEQYYDKASTDFEGGAYQSAVEHYRELLDQYPFSEYSEEAELKIGHAHYLNRSCPEAIAAFTDFQRRHPTSPYLPLVGFLLGQCYEQQMRPPDRDQSASQNAHAYYLALTQQYPESPYADLARDRLANCRETLAKHEMEVAEYYQKRDNLRAAEYRMLDLVNRFDETDAAGNALYRLGQLYQKEGESKRAALAYAAVTQHHATSELAGQARDALAGLKLEDTTTPPDALAALKADTGRSRTLALTQVVEVPSKGAPREPTGGGFGPGIGAGALPGQGGGPFGGSY